MGLNPGYRPLMVRAQPIDGTSPKPVCKGPRIVGEVFSRDSLYIFRYSGAVLRVAEVARRRAATSVFSEVKFPYGRGWPPVTPRTSPFTKLDSWEARNTKAGANSAGWAGLPIGEVPPNWAA